MSRNIRVSEPSAEMQIKIIRAKDAIASQKPRTVRCPYYSIRPHTKVNKR